MRLSVTEVFAADNAICRLFASGQTEGGEVHVNIIQILTSAVPVVLSAGIGWAFGGKGAAIGGALGVAGGVEYGGIASGKAQSSPQQRYDMGFDQCMQIRHNWLLAQSAGR